MTVRRRRYWPAWTAGLLALGLGLSGLTAGMDAALRNTLPFVAGSHLQTATPLPGAPWWSAAIAALLCLRLPAGHARHAAWRGLPLALLPLLVALLLWRLLECWLPPLAAATAILSTVLLHTAWQARDPHRVLGADGLRRAARRALQDEDVLPCSLLRLQLQGPRRLPWNEVLPALRARTRRGGDRLTRCGRDGAALWLVSTDAHAAETISEELRMDLAGVMARHGLYCRLGRATQAAPGGDVKALWDAAAPG